MPQNQTGNWDREDQTKGAPRTQNTTEQDRGPGMWRIVTYDPKGACGEFEGNLVVTRDHHIVTRESREGRRVTLCEVPNQNVAICYNPRFVQNPNQNYEPTNAVVPVKQDTTT